MEQNLLIDDLQPEMVQASTGKRFLNSLIDSIGFYAVIFAILIPILIVNPSMVEEDEYGNSALDGIGFNVAVYLFYFVYYFLFEYVTGGRSLGKLITGTRVVMEDGSKMDISTAMKRNAIRLIPLEVFSAFGSPCYPWHDKWSHTYVIDIKKSNAIISIT
jgi:uncharacterized RDD family membrane protein YckC